MSKKLKFNYNTKYFEHKEESIIDFFFFFFGFWGTNRLPNAEEKIRSTVT